MDIAAVSMGMAAAEFQTAASVAVLKKTMEAEEIQAEALSLMLQAAAPSHLGKMVDTYA